MKFFPDTAESEEVEKTLMGAGVCRMPVDLVNNLLNHPLTDADREKFLSDLKKSGEK